MAFLAKNLSFWVENMLFWHKIGVKIEEWAEKGLILKTKLGEKCKYGAKNWIFFVENCRFHTEIIKISRLVIFEDDKLCFGCKHKKYTLKVHKYVILHNALFFLFLTVSTPLYSNMSFTVYL